MNISPQTIDEVSLAQNDPELLFSDYQEFLRVQHLYKAAVQKIQLRLETINEEFSVTHNRSPIHHIESRLKAPRSIVEKLKRRGYPVTVEAAIEHINDIAGIRVVCSYIEDVYRVEDILMQQKDLVLVDRTDYIAEPNFNGYRSLHLDFRVPVYLSDRTKFVLAEIQIRSVAMDFWASLEHDLRYKGNKEKLPPDINEEMHRCADEIAAIDRKMQDMYRKIIYAE